MTSESEEVTLYQPDVMVTYRYADGAPVGEYDHVLNLEFFESEGDYFEVIEEQWTKSGERLHRFGSLDVWCQLCEADFTLAKPTPPPYFCPGCVERTTVS